MKTRSDNIRTSPGEHALLWIAPAALALFSLSAVVAPGTRGESNDAELLDVRKRAEDCETKRATLADFQRAGGLEHVRALERAAAASLPESIAPFEVQAHARLLARTLGFELESVDLAEEREPAMPLVAGGVSERPLVVRAQGLPERLPEFVDALRQLGHPLSVNSVELGRSARGEKRFHLRIELGLFQRARKAPVQIAAPNPEAPPR
ncbi:MAG: hypothetical protein HZA53_02260 [Planctomycetes bacterium]|nr:hypothetical protein [Planctomycetota bacterium]